LTAVLLSTTAVLLGYYWHCNVGVKVVRRVEVPDTSWDLYPPNLGESVVCAGPTVASAATGRLALRVVATLADDAGGHADWNHTVRVGSSTVATGATGVVVLTVTSGERGAAEQSRRTSSQSRCGDRDDSALSEPAVHISS
jgi:hypothetical protein